MTLNVDLKWYSGSAIVSRMSEYLVIVDAFRATSIIPTLLDKGVARIIPVALVEEALQMKEKNPEYIAVGEDRGKMPPGFAFGNSPSRIFTNAENVDFNGKTVIHRSSAGTQAISKALKVKEEQNAKYTIFTSSFLNAGAVARFIAVMNGGRDERLSVLCSGYVDKIYALEDELGGGALINEIVATGASVKMSEAAASAYLSFRGVRDEDFVQMLRSTKSAAKIIEVGDEPDIEFCSRLNRFEVVPTVRDGAIVNADLK